MNHVPLETLLVGYLSALNYDEMKQELDLTLHSSDNFSEFKRFRFRQISHFSVDGDIQAAFQDCAYQGIVGVQYLPTVSSETSRHNATITCDDFEVSFWAPFYPDEITVES